MADATKSSPEPAGTPGTGLTKKQRQRQRKRQQQKQKQQQNGQTKTPAAAEAVSYTQEQDPVKAESDVEINDVAIPNEADTSPERDENGQSKAPAAAVSDEQAQDPVKAQPESEPEPEVEINDAAILNTADTSPERDESGRGGADNDDEKGKEEEESGTMKRESVGELTESRDGNDAGPGLDKGGDDMDGGDNVQVLKEERDVRRMEGSKEEEVPEKEKEEKVVNGEKSDADTDTGAGGDRDVPKKDEDEAIVEAPVESDRAAVPAAVPVSASGSKAMDTDKSVARDEKEGAEVERQDDKAQEKAAHEAPARAQPQPQPRRSQELPHPPHTTTTTKSPYAAPPPRPLDSEKFHPRTYHAPVSATAYHPPISSSIPPPPTDAEVQRMHEQARHQAQVHEQQQGPPPQQPEPNLSHPPGYIQNPLALSSPSPASSTSPAPDQTGTGHWSWSPAPGDAGGRYVYHPSSLPREAEWVYIDANGNEYPGPSVQGSAYIDSGSSTGIGSGDVDDWTAWLGEVWEGAVGWVRGVGGVVAGWEEGVWRWVNERT